MRGADPTGAHRDRARGELGDAQVGERRAHPTTSAMESQAPTSWNCTSSGSMPCTRASASASRANTASAGSRDGRRAGRPPSSSAADLGPGAVRVILGGARHVDLASRAARPGHRAASDRDLAGHHGGHRGLHRGERRTGVEQRAEQHVARDPGGGVDPGGAQSAYSLLTGNASGDRTGSGATDGNRFRVGGVGS